MIITKKTVSFKTWFGRDWIVSHYDPFSKDMISSKPMDYHKACNTIKNDKIAWNTKLQRYDDIIPAY